MFAGGNTGSESAVVDAYNRNLSRNSPISLSAASYDLAATTLGDYALFAGGHLSTSFSTVDAFSISK